MNGYIKRSVWFAAALLGWSLMVSSAQAASFDCAKAASKVEKLICGDAGLSKLDEELNAAYKTALHEEKQVASIRLAQKQWMWRRDGCLGIDCLKATYQARIHELTATPVKVEALPQSAQSKEENADIESTKKYLPYPDVWELKVPPSGKQKHTGIRSAYLQNGDVRIGYISPDKAESRTIQGIPSTDLSWITFFSRQLAVVVDETSEEARLNDGITVKPIWRIRGKDYYPGTAVLKDGSYIIASPSTFWRGCYQGPTANTLTRYQSKVMKKPLQPSKVVLLLLDDPITISTGSVDGPNRPAACDAAEKEVTTRVVSLAGEVLPLEDGGFLLIDENYGLVIRFDTHLNTQSKMLNKKIFVIDGSLGQLSIDEFKFKNYMDKNGWTKMQQLSDDLYAYLIKLSKGEK